MWDLVILLHINILGQVYDSCLLAPTKLLSKINNHLSKKTLFLHLHQCVRNKWYRGIVVQHHSDVKRNQHINWLLCWLIFRSSSRCCHAIKLAFVQYLIYFEFTFNSICSCTNSAIYLKFTCKKQIHDQYSSQIYWVFKHILKDHQFRIFLLHKDVSSFSIFPILKIEHFTDL